MYKKCTNSHANGSSGAWVRFYGAYGVCGGCVASVFNSDIKDAITMQFQMLFNLVQFYQITWLTLPWDKDCANTVLMFQWRFGNCSAIFFFCREVCILNLRSPGKISWKEIIFPRIWFEYIYIYVFALICCQVGINKIKK